MSGGSIGAVRGGGGEGVAAEGVWARIGGLYSKNFLCKAVSGGSRGRAGRGCMR